MNDISHLCKPFLEKFKNISSFAKMKEKLAAIQSAIERKKKKKKEALTKINE